MGRPQRTKGRELKPRFWFCWSLLNRTTSIPSSCLNFCFEILNWGRIRVRLWSARSKDDVGAGGRPGRCEFGKDHLAFPRGDNCLMKGEANRDHIGTLTARLADTSDCPISAQLRPNGVMFGYSSLARTTKNHEDTKLELP